MEKIVIASNNKGKIKEIKEIFTDYELLSLKEANVDIEVDEDQPTFEKNSQKKAKEIAEYVKLNCLSDDSGICIDILDGWPGVYTARFLGEDATQAERNNHILEKMKDYKGDDRNAKVVCCISYYDYEAKEVISCEGVINGKIALEKRGENGFGFDEIFELPNGKTLAELSVEEKNNVSARKIALNMMNNEILKKKLLNKALEYARKQHEGQTRDEGVPYFTHIEGVVEILEKELNVTDAETLVVAALHDTLEDTDTTFEDLESMFGIKIATCTELLNKNGCSSKEEYFTRIFENKEYDLVAKVKLADRIHNMRCLIKTNKIEKITRKIKETEEYIFKYETEENSEYMNKIKEAITNLRNHFNLD